MNICLEKDKNGAGKMNVKEISLPTRIASTISIKNFETVIFKDDINANKDATDYKSEVIKITSKDKIPIPLQNGGGWAARIYPSK